MPERHRWHGSSSPRYLDRPASREIRPSQRGHPRGRGIAERILSDNHLTPMAALSGAPPLALARLGTGAAPAARYHDSSAVYSCRSPVGHFDQSPPTSPSVGCRFGQRTFAGATRNGRDAPVADPGGPNVAGSSRPFSDFRLVCELVHTGADVSCVSVHACRRLQGGVVMRQFCITGATDVRGHRQTDHAPIEVLVQK